MPVRKKLPRRSGMRRSASDRLRDELARAVGFLSGSRWEEGLAILQRLRHDHPRDPVVLHMVIDTYLSFDWPEEALETAEELVEAWPEYGLAHVILAKAQTAAGYPGLAHRTLADYLRRWPVHPDSARARDAMQQIREPLIEMGAVYGLGEEDSLQMRALRDEADLMRRRGQLTEARARYEELLGRYPSYGLGYVGYAESWLDAGDLAQATKVMEQAVAAQPQEAYLASLLIGYLAMQGRIDEARALGRRVLEMPEGKLSRWSAQILALATIADYQGAVETYVGAKKAGYAKLDNVSQLFLDIAAFAYHRLGDVKEARRLWKQALKIDPTFSEAREALALLDEAGEDAPRPGGIAIHVLLTPSARKDLADVWDRIESEDTERAREEARRFLEQHPEVENVLPLALEIGDQRSIRLANLLLSLRRAHPSC